MNACMGRTGCRKQQMDDNDDIKIDRRLRRNKKDKAKPVKDLASQMNHDLSRDDEDGQPLEREDSFVQLDLEDAMISGQPSKVNENDAKSFNEMSADGISN